MAGRQKSGMSIPQDSSPDNQVCILRFSRSHIPMFLFKNGCHFPYLSQIAVSYINHEVSIGTSEIRIPSQATVIVIYVPCCYTATTKKGFLKLCYNYSGTSVSSFPDYKLLEDT